MTVDEKCAEMSRRLDEIGRSLGRHMGAVINIARADLEGVALGRKNGKSALIAEIFARHPQKLARRRRYIRRYERIRR